ncbi:uncharacterized protein LOC131010034 [Salvia miltiorrhiza]|uniref:uncharacterized protein LOC131010034 n=1 Tax=Salvia miltiorrhiza TaxID=226208 RepID=UPI0025AC1945|nr:uncharacterized protein LOC131010034 [Salvia miltiorrhiza]
MNDAVSQNSSSSSELESPSTASAPTGLDSLKAPRELALALPLAVVRDSGSTYALPAYRQQYRARRSSPSSPCSSPNVELVKITQDMKSFKAYDKLRLERTNARHVGVRAKRAAEAEKEDKK